MELDGSKRICGFCKEWLGQREWVDGKVKVKASAWGICKRLGKRKPVHGGCDFHEKWDGTPVEK